MKLNIGTALRELDYIENGENKYGEAYKHPA